jgi:hypothetical protein
MHFRPSESCGIRRTKETGLKRRTPTLRGARVNKVSICRTSLAIPQGSGVGCNTTSSFSGSRHYVSNYFSFTSVPVVWALEWGVLGLKTLSKVL